MRNIALFMVLVFVAGTIVSCGEEDASPQHRIVKMVEKDVTPKAPPKERVAKDEKNTPTEEPVSMTQYINTDIRPLEEMRILCNKWSNERKVQCDIYSQTSNSCHIVQGCRDGASATATEACLGYIECTTP